MFNLKAILPLTFFISISCRQRSGDFSRDLHDEGRIAAGRFPSYWGEVSPEYHEKVVKAISKMQDPESNINVLWKHSIIERLQVWVDAMDKEARNTVWGRKYMAATPRPRVLLTDVESPNAFIAPAFLKYQADVLIPGSNNLTEEVPLLMTSEGTPNPMASILEGFVPVENGVQKMLGNVVDRQKFVSEKLGHKCLPNNAGPGKIVFKGCELGENQDAIHSGAYLSKQTSPYVTVNIGLLRIMNEESVVSIIGHELGHYYRAHATDDNRIGQGGFFYYEKDAANGRRPEPITDKAIEQLGREAIESTKNRAPNAIQGAKIDSQVLMGLINSLYFESLPAYSDLKASNFPNDSDEFGMVPGRAILLRKCRLVHAKKSDCDSFERALKDPEIVKVFLSNATPEKKAYLALESAFQSFSMDLKIGSGNPLVDSENIPLFGSFINKDRKSVSIASACQSYFFRVARQQYIPLDQLLTGCGMQIEKNRKEADALVNKVVLKGIGWYTTEQEADEIAAEFIASVGIDPTKATAGLWDLFKYVTSRNVKPTGVDYPTCLKLASNNFGFGTGSVRTVSLGDWSEIHHDLCYRIYNSSRDLFAHNYKFDVSKRPQFKLAWDSEVKLLPSPKGLNAPRPMNDAFFIE